MRTLVITLIGACVPLALHAQQRDSLPVRDELPRDVAHEVVALFNATTTLRATDRIAIEAGREVAGDVAVLNGPLTLGGHVRGRVLAINGDVILLRGARIDGDLLVVGGEVEGSDGAMIGGELRNYHPPLRHTQGGDRLVAQPEGTRQGEPGWRTRQRAGRGNSEPTANPS